MLQLRPLFLTGDAGEDREPLVDLQRIAGDRDRVLATLAQQLGERHRHTGLADPGGAEDRYDLHRGIGCATTPASVCEVASVISTPTRSPGFASPSKLTALLWRVRPRSLVSSVRLAPSTSTSISRPTKRWARSAARRWTRSTRRSMRSTLTGCGTWSSNSAASVSRRGEKTKVKAPS